MSKILLLAINGNEDNRSTLYDQNLYEFKSRSRLWNTPNLGLLTIGAFLSRQYIVDYLDLNYENIQNIDYDIVFMSPTTSQALKAYQLSCEFRKNGTKVIMGGPHVSMLPKEALQFSDGVFIGEAEDTLEDFINGRCRAIYQCDRRPDLYKSPIPLYELTTQYPYSSIPVQISRGCPHQCEFCLSSTIYGKSIRRKSVEQVKNELIKIKSLYQNPFIFFTDDNFFINENYSMLILDIIESLKLNWYAFTDISVYKKEKILKRLYKCGCRKLLIGFESLNVDNLNQINRSGFKSSKIKEYKRAIQTIQMEKIGVVGSFVLGLENDTEKTFDDLYEFILDTCLYGTNITIATPFPGTKLFQKSYQEHKIDLNWSLYDGFSLVKEIPNISKENFMINYKKLISKVNSMERIENVIKFFKEK